MANKTFALNAVTFYNFALHHNHFRLLKHTNVAHNCKFFSVKQQKKNNKIKEHGLLQWFSTWGLRTLKWSANDFEGAVKAKGFAPFFALHCSALDFGRKIGRVRTC